MLLLPIPKPNPNVNDLISLLEKITNDILAMDQKMYRLESKMEKYF